MRNSLIFSVEILQQLKPNYYMQKKKLKQNLLTTLEVLVLGQNLTLKVDVKILITRDQEKRNK